MCYNSYSQGQVVIKFEKFLRQAIFQVSQKFTSAFRACQQLKTEVHLQAKEGTLEISEIYSISFLFVHSFRRFGHQLQIIIIYLRHL